MKYTIIATALSFFLIAACSSNKVSSDNMNGEMVETMQYEKGLLWEIDGKGMSESSFLFGTIHMIASEDYFLPEGTLSAIDATQRMVFEIDMADLSDPMKLMPIMQKAYMKGDTSLQDLLSDEDYSLVKDHFQEMGLPIMFLERIKPMFLTVFASGDFDPTDLNSGSVKSYEMEFAAIAENSGKTTGGLETVDYQIGLFDAIPYSDQADMLLDAIKNGDVENDSFKELVNKYKDQDVEALYSMMQADDATAEYEDVLLTTRNKNWIPQMITMMGKERVFFAVGAGHLGGPNGVINLLRKEGYTVRPVKSL